MLTIVSVGLKCRNTITLIFKVFEQNKIKQTNNKNKQTTSKTVNLLGVKEPDGLFLFFCFCFVLFCFLFVCLFVFSLLVGVFVCVLACLLACLFSRVFMNHFRRNYVFKAEQTYFIILHNVKSTLAVLLKPLALKTPFDCPICMTYG